jgi:hypothetical protein
MISRRKESKHGLGLYFKILIPNVAARDLEGYNQDAR